MGTALVAVRMAPLLPEQRDRAALVGLGSKQQSPAWGQMRYSKKKGSK